MIYLFCFNQPGRNFFEAKINSGYFNRIISLCQFVRIKLSIFIGDLMRPLDFFQNYTLILGISGSSSSLTRGELRKINYHTHEEKQGKEITAVEKGRGKEKRKVTSRRERSLMSSPIVPRPPCERDYSVQDGRLWIFEVSPLPQVGKRRAYGIYPVGGFVVKFAQRDTRRFFSCEVRLTPEAIRELGIAEVKDLRAKSIELALTLLKQGREQDTLITMTHVQEYTAVPPEIPLSRHSLYQLELIKFHLSHPMVAED